MYNTKEDLDSIKKKIKDELRKQGISIEDSEFCVSLIETSGKDDDLKMIRHNKVEKLCKMGLLEAFIEASARAGIDWQYTSREEEKSYLFIP